MKNALWIIIGLVVIAGVGFTLVDTDDEIFDDVDDVMEEQQENQEQEQEEDNDEGTESNEEDEIQDDSEQETEKEAMETTEPRLVTYNVGSETTASYVAQKAFFSKPTEEVVGTTGDVSGSVTLDRANETLSLTLAVNPKTFNTGSGGRDSHVAGLFDGDVALTAENVSTPGVSRDGDIGFIVPVTLTINGTTETIDFAVTGAISDGSLTGTGSGVVSLNAFGIEAPSILDLYVVEDQIGLTFELVAGT